jgi:hypothetical protein
MMNLRRGMLVALASVGMLLAGCGDDDDGNGPDGNGTAFTAEEKEALSTAFVSTGLVPDDPQAGQLYGLLLGGVESYGTITIPAALRGAPASGLRLASIAGEYDATGLQYIFDITINGEPAFQALSAGIVAWSGLDVQAETIDDWISIGATDESATEFPDEVSGIIPDDVSAEYYVAATETLYEGISGSASITHSSFSGTPTDCTVEIPTVGTLTCSYQYGSMEGAFDFVAQPVLVEGENATFASTSYDLPAVRVSISGNLTVEAAQVPALRSALRKLVRAH